MPKSILKNKRILLFVSGGIAIYKALDLIRILRKNGAFVRVVASESALKFINPITFESLSGTPLLYDSNESWSFSEDKAIDSNITQNPPLNHIGYARWAQLALFVPITANSINKLANGIADNMYLNTAIALRKIACLIAPSANTFMLENPATKANIERLRNFGYKIIESRSDILACGDVGNGAMASIDEIIFRLLKELYLQDFKFYFDSNLKGVFQNLDSINLQNLNSNFNERFWRNKRVIITAGSSSEPIDDIRCISNNSSGLQGANLALALYFLGAKVVLITSKTPLKLPKDIVIKNVITSNDYLESLRESMRAIKGKVFLFMSAAISDYIPEAKIGKMKKDSIGAEFDLHLKQNIDILQYLDSNDFKQSCKKIKLIKIAFKAECDESKAIANAKKLLDSKNCFAVCLNIINAQNRVFNSDYNEIYFITKDSIIKLKGSKFNISLALLAIFCNYEKIYIL